MGVFDFECNGCGGGARKCLSGHPNCDGGNQNCSGDGAYIGKFSSESKETIEYFEKCFNLKITTKKMFYGSYDGYGRFSLGINSAKWDQAYPNYDDLVCSYILCRSCYSSTPHKEILGCSYKYDLSKYDLIKLALQHLEGKGTYYCIKDKIENDPQLSKINVTKFSQDTLNKMVENGYLNKKGNYYHLNDGVKPLKAGKFRYLNMDEQEIIKKNEKKINRISNLSNK